MNVTAPQVDESWRTSAQNSIERDKAAASTNLARYRSTTAELGKRYRSFDKPVAKIMRSKDKPLSKDDEKTLSDWQLVGHQYRSMLASVTRLEQKIEALNNPAELDRRMNGAKPKEQDPLDESSSGKPSRRSNMAKASAEKHEVPKSVIDRIVKDINGGKSLGEVAKALDAEKIKPPGRSETWGTGRAVQTLYVKATGHGIKDARAKSPLEKTRPLKEREPAPAARAPKAPKTKSGTVAAAAKTVAAKTEAKPIDKKSQAAGTSRGGSGTRKSQQPKRQTAKIRNPKRSK